MGPKRGGRLQRNSKPEGPRLLKRMVWAVGASVAAGAAWAQDQQDSALTEVVVTAEFKQASVQDTPLAITAVSGEMLEARSQTNILQVASQAPNVTLQPGGATFGPALQAFIRGIGQDDFNLAYEPGVGLYVDDVYYSVLSGSALDLIDLERIEVLRGPQGTLSGRNSIGGAIKLYSVKPKGDDSGYLAATYGAYERQELRGAYDFGIVENLALRLSGVTRSEEGYVDRIDWGCENPGSGVPNLSNTASGNCIVGTQGGRSFVATRAAFRWTPSESVEVNVVGDYTDDSSEGQPNQLAALDVQTPSAAAAVANTTLGSAPNLYLSDAFVTRGRYITYASFANPDSPFGAYAVQPVSQTDSWGVSSTIDWDFTELFSIKSITAYRESDTVFTNDTSGSPIPFSVTRDRVTSEQLTQELRLNGSAGPVDFTVGGFLVDAHNRDEGRVDIYYVAPTFGHLIDDPVDAKSHAAFGHAVWHLTDRLNLTTGIRYTDESKDYTYTRKSQAGDGTVAIPTGLGVDGASAGYSGTKTDYRANVDYHFTESTLGYVQFATGFKGGGPNPRPFFADQLSVTFGPETLDSYELGVKTDLFDRRVRLNAAAFYGQYKDKQIVLFACPTAPCAAPENAGDADIKGAELEATLAPLQGLLIDASASYLDFKYTSLNPAVLPTGVTLSSTAAFAPEWQGSIGAQYEGNLPGGSALIPRIDGSYKSDFYTDARNLPGSLIEAYWLWNARLTWRSAKGDFTTALEVTNLFDKFYYQSLLDISAFNGIVQGSPAPPRRWALTLRKSF